MQNSYIYFNDMWYNAFQFSVKTERNNNCSSPSKNSFTLSAISLTLETLLCHMCFNDTLYGLKLSETAVSRYLFRLLIFSQFGH